MPINHRKKVTILSIDGGLVGLWQTGPTVVRITSDGWYYLVGSPVPYSISPDGQILTYPASNPSSTYQRTLGSGPSIIGTWEQTTTDGSDTWIEEVYFRINGTYTGQWTLNGTFDSEFLGNYTDTLTHIETEERRAIVETTSPNNITFDPLYSSFDSGTYTIDAGGNQWTYQSSAGDIVYDRV